MLVFKKLLKWLKAEFNQMHFLILFGYLCLAFWVVFLDDEITQTAYGFLLKLFFEMTGILGIGELLKRLFPQFDWEKKD